MEDVYTVNVMTGTVITTNEDVDVGEAAEKMSENHIGSLVVKNDEDDVVGIITESDIVHAVAEQTDLGGTTVDECMTEDLITASPSDQIEAAAERMAEHSIKKLPVVNDEGNVIGIVTTTDLTQYIPHHRYAFGE